MLVVMATCVWTSAFAQDAKEAGKVVAEVDGTKLTMGDYEAKHPTALFHARNVYFQSERKALSDFVDEYLLERQAEREHVTVDQLLEQHVRGTVKDPSEEALHVFYEGADTPQPYEAVRNQILEQIRQGRFAKAKAAYVKTLRESSNVTLRLEPPRVPVSLKDAALHGSMQAPVTMVEFGDYECPYCKGVEPMLSKLQAQYGPKLAIAYKDAPLPMHNLAKKAAEAAHCAGEQGKYWEYHDRLFSTRQLETPQLKEHARALKLNAEQFDKCLDSGSQSALVDAQLEEAQKFQVEGTPTFFINGRLYSGAFTVEQFSAVINEELGAVAAGSVSATAAMGK
jgi:protein-disulfide isomerase